METKPDVDAFIIELYKKGKINSSIKVCMAGYNVDKYYATKHVKEITKGIIHTPAKIISAIFLISVFIILLVLINKGCSSNEPVVKLSAQQIDSTRKAERISRQFNLWNGSHINTVIAIKEMMNDPNSFEHVNTDVWESGDTGFLIKMTYRGKNAFGGVITNTIISRVDTAGKVLKIIEANE
jgi:hypothetical protein